MKKMILLIMDGFGYREEPHGNAIIDANMITFNELWKKYYVSSFEYPIKKTMIVKPILDENMQYMHRDNNNLISIRDILLELNLLIVI